MISDNRIDHAPPVMLVAHADAPADGCMLAGGNHGRRGLGAVYVNDVALVCSGCADGVQGALLLALGK